MEKHKTPHLREYVYIDNTEINSILAQLNQGLELKETSSSSKDEGASKSHSKNGKAEGSTSAGLNWLAELSGKASLGYDLKTAQSVNVVNEESVETILSDYSVEVLEENLSSQGLLTDATKATIGDFISINDQFNITNFKSLRNSADTNAMEQFIDYSTQQEEEQINNNSALNKVARKDAISKIRANNNASKKELKKIINMISLMGEYGTALFPNAVLISGNSFVSYCELSNFRMSEAQLNMLTNSSRKINLLGIVENIQKDAQKYINGDLPELNPSEIGNVNTLMQNVLLSSFDILKNGSFIVKPLAIYFND